MKPRICAFIILVTMVALSTAPAKATSLYFMQASSPTYTIAPLTNGVAIITQDTGAVTYCTSSTLISGTSATPNGNCALLGRVTPTLPGVSLSLAVSGTDFYVMNNVTGVFIQCVAINNISGSTSTPGGSCKAMGSTFR
jgi:hypothetical protein